MAWIRDTDEKAQRRPADIALLVVAGILAVLVGHVGADPVDRQRSTSSTRSTTCPGTWSAWPRRIYALGSIWAALAVTVVLLVDPPGRVAWHGALAAAVAWGIAELLNELLGTHDDQGPRRQRPHRRRPGLPGRQRRHHHRARVRPGALSRAPAAPDLRASSSCWCALAAMYLGAGFPADVLGGLLVGFAVAALVRVVFGSPGGRPSVAEVRDALTDLGYDVAEHHHADERVARASVMDVELGVG